MAIGDFTNQNIQDTYKRVVQTDGTNLADGSGSLLPISFNGNNVIISGSLTAQTYVVSESIINISSGSTIFGNSLDDIHRFTGSISVTGSVNVKRNVTIGIHDGYNSQGVGSKLFIQRYGSFYPEAHIYCGDDSVTTSVGFQVVTRNGSGTAQGAFEIRGTDRRALFAGNIEAQAASFTTLNTSGNGTLGDATSDVHTVNGTLTGNNTISTSTMVEAPTGSFKLLKGDQTKATGLFVGGSITSSGDISASGTISSLDMRVGHLGSPNGRISFGEEGNKSYPQFIQSEINQLKLQRGNGVGTLVKFNLNQHDDGPKVLIGGDISASGYISTETNITASGNISSSGNLTVSQSLTFGSNNARISFGEKLTIGNSSENDYIKIVDEQIKFVAGGLEAMVIRDANNDILLGYSGIDAVWCGGSGNQLWKTDIANSRTDMVRRTRMAPSHSFANDDGVSRLYVSGSTNLDGNVTASGNISASGDITASGFFGDGSGLTNVSATLPAGTISGSAQLPSGIISSSLQNLGNITGSNISSSGAITASGLLLPQLSPIEWVSNAGQKQTIKGTDNYIQIDGDNRVLISADNDVTVTSPLTSFSGNVSSSATIIGNIISGSTISGSFVGDGSGITNLVTTANVTTAGALMDSEVDADIKTLALPASTTISTFGASLIDDAAASNARTTLGLGTVATTAAADYATAAQGTKADSAQQPPSEGAFANGDKTKLDGIAAGATANAGDATLAGTQTFTGDKSFTGAVTASGITIEGPISASGANGYIIAKTPVIVLNTTDDTTDMYIDYSNTSDGSGGTLATALGGTQIPWDKQEIIDTDFFTHDTSTNNERITFKYAGRYEIIFALTYNKDSARACPVVRPYTNGQWGGFRFQTNPMYQRASGGQNNASLNGSYIMEFDAGDYFSLASGYVANFGNTPSGGGMVLKKYNTTHGHSKLMIKMIG